jgi:DNA-binding NarL/FixJ family response regulator
MTERSGSLGADEAEEAATIRVLIADDQELVRTGFRLILSDLPGITVVGDAADGRAAVELTNRLRPHVVLMDIRMPVIDGLAATRALVADPVCPSRIVILTTFDDDEFVYAAIDAGASGYLLKDAPAEQLIGAIRVVAAGEAILAPAVTTRILRDVASRRRDTASALAVQRLSRRETEVLEHMAEGRSNQEIAANLVLSEATVKTHVARILAKLEARDRVQAVVMAYRSGLARP